MVFWPGSNVIRDTGADDLAGQIFNFILNSGRAVRPAGLQGHLQRSDSLHERCPGQHDSYRDHVIMWAKDLSRALDYLETRPDVTTEPLAYYGVSWGGRDGRPDSRGRAPDQGQPCCTSRG